jgi:hypothetical protein
MTMNEWGLSWVRWYRAATCYHHKPSSVPIASLRKAWANGEDPSDYAVDFAKAGEERPMTAAIRKLTIAVCVQQ